MNCYKPNTNASYGNPYSLLRSSTDIKIEPENETVSKPPLSLRYINNNVNRREAKPVSPMLCNCERKMRNILCRSCGFLFFGRIRAACNVHPTIIHLMDINCCPKCRAGLLKEFSMSTRDGK